MERTSKNHKVDKKKQGKLVTYPNLGLLVSPSLQAKTYIPTLQICCIRVTFESESPLLTSNYLLSQMLFCFLVARYMTDHPKAHPHSAPREDRSYCSLSKRAEAEASLTRTESKLPRSWGWESASANAHGLLSFPCLPELFSCDWIIPDIYLQGF